MRIGYIYGGHRHEITTEHSASSYNLPVLLVSGELIGQVHYEPDEIELPSALQRLADEAGVWGGSATRKALNDLAEELLGGVERPRGADYDRVVDEFIRRGHLMRGDDDLDSLVAKAREDGVPIPGK